MMVPAKDGACGGESPFENSKHDSRCQDAKFNECSECEALIVSNRSNFPVKVDTTLTGSGFSESGNTAMFGFCGKASGKKAAAFTTVCQSLEPGENCIRRFQFCPEQAGVSRAQLRVNVTDSGSSRTTMFTLVGKADYSQALAAADAVRKKHLPELLKIPNVKRVSLSQVNGKILINVEVGSGPDDDKQPQNVRLARHIAPPKLDGYSVEVTEYVSPPGVAY